MASPGAALGNNRAGTVLLGAILCFPAYASDSSGSSASAPPVPRPGQAGPPRSPSLAFWFAFAAFSGAPPAARGSSVCQDSWAFAASPCGGGSEPAAAGEAGPGREGACGSPARPLHPGRPSKPRLRQGAGRNSSQMRTSCFRVGPRCKAWAAGAAAVTCKRGCPKSRLPFRSEGALTGPGETRPKEEREG